MLVKAFSVRWKEMVTARATRCRGPERLEMARAQLDKSKKPNLIYVKVGLALARSMARHLLAPSLGKSLFTRLNFQHGK